MEKAEALEVKERDGDAIVMLKAILASTETSELALRVREKAIYHIGKLYGKLGKANELKTLLTELRPFFSLIPKARTTKIVRSLIDLLSKLPGLFPPPSPRFSPSRNSQPLFLFHHFHLLFFFFFRH